MMRFSSTCVLALLLASAATSSAQRLVVDVPQRVAARGVDLRAGDVIDLPAGALDGTNLRRLEVEQATRAPVTLERMRDGASATLDLPVGSWDLETLPVSESRLQQALPSLRAARDWPRALAALDGWSESQTDVAARAEGLLLRARWLGLSGDWATADATLEEAIALVPEHTADYIEAHLRTLERRVDRRAGLVLAERLVVLRDNASPERRAHALLLRGRARSLLRDNAGASADANEALGLVGGGVDLAQAQVLLGFSALRAGERERAAAAFEAARTSLESLAPGSLELGAVLAQQATLAGITGAQDTLVRFEVALALLRRLASDLPLLGTTTMNAHLMAMQRGRFDAAEAYARESLAAFQATAPDTLFEQQARTALADVLLRRAQFAEAETLFTEALAIANAIDPASYEALSTRLQLGQAQLAQGRHADAHSSFDALLSAVEAAPEDGPVGTTTLAADTRVYRMQAAIGLGRFDSARSDGELALARYEELNRTETIRAETLLGIAEAAWRAGDLVAARERTEDALARYVAVGAGAIQLSAAHFLRARVRHHSGDIDGALADYDAAIDGLERHRSVVGGDDDIRARWAAQYQDYYKEPMLLRARRGDASGAAALEQRYRAQLLRRLLVAPEAAPSAWAAQGDPGKALAPDQALVSFVVGTEAVLAFTWRAGDDEPRLDLIALPADRLSAQVDRLRVLSARGDAPPAAIAAFDSLSYELYQTLFNPLLPAIDNAPRWTLVADGVLRRLPFAALATDAGAQPARLVESRALAFAASPAVFAQARTRRDEAGTVVGFADVDPELAPARDPLRHPDFAVPLPGARREVEALASLHGARARRFLGADASEARAREQAPGAAILHFAVHGVLDARDPTRSFLALARGAGGETDDGRLSAAEIAALDLPGSLVVLSSCESALGGDAGGEGLLGMSRALAAAGAGEVLGTLWRVPDAPTASVLIDFHRQLHAGAPADIALARAQRAWLVRAREVGWMHRIGEALGVVEPLPAEPEQPFHWAGFALEQSAGLPP